MKNPCARFFVLATVVWASVGACIAQDISVQPKYGLIPKTAEQTDADAKFLAIIDGYCKGDRKKPANEIAARGWQMLREGHLQDAMRRFNQAWLLDNSNSAALWGMGAIQANTGKAPESLPLFAEAEPALKEDTNFAVDYAKAIGIAGAQAKRSDLMKDAFARFDRIYQKNPQHTSNLQNWAITLF
jgi:tetratricopeptide (TPR) repeat protein